MNIDNSQAISHCKKCGSAEFYASGRCKPCARARATEYRLNNPEKVRAIKAKWYLQNKARNNQRGQAWKRANKPKVAASAAEYRLRNLELVRDRARATQAKKPEYYQAMRKSYRQRNKDLVSKRNSDWKRINKEKVRLYTANRLARKKGVGGTLSNDIAERLLRLQKWRCAGCRISLKQKKYHLDHIVALSKNGRNIDSNIQILCVSCNCSKGAKHPTEFMQKLGYLI